MDTDYRTELMTISARLVAEFLSGQDPEMADLNLMKYYLENLMREMALCS